MFTVSSVAVTQHMTDFPLRNSCGVIAVADAEQKLLGWTAIAVAVAAVVHGLYSHRDLFYT